MCRCGAKQDNRPGRKNRLGKIFVANVVAPFPLSKIAHLSILLRGNGWSPNYCRSGGTDPILSTQRIPRGRDLIFSTQRMPRRRELIFSTHTFSGPLWDFVNEKRRLYIEKFSRCAGEMVKSQRVWYEWNFPAARAKTLRNPRRKRHMHSNYLILRSQKQKGTKCFFLYKPFSYRIS